MRLAKILFLIIWIVFTQNSIAQWVHVEGPYGGGISGVVRDSNGVMFAPSNFELLKTSNISEGWDTVRTSPDRHNVILLTQDNVLLVATDSGAVRSFDGGVTWEDASTGLQGKITSMNQLPGGRIVSITKVSDTEFYICTSDNNGTMWNGVPYDGGFIVSNLEIDPVTGYAYFVSSINGPYLFLSWSSNGIDWQVTNLSQYFNYYQDFMIDTQGRLYLLYGSGFAPPSFYLKRSSDYGQTWTTLLFFGYDCPTQVAQIDNGDLIITHNSTAFTRSVDDGATWQNAGTGVPRMALELVYDVPGDTLIGQSNNGVYYSPDNGYTWLWGSDGITPFYIPDLAVSDSGIIIATTENTRLWKSNDDGIIWQDITMQVPSFYDCKNIMFSGGHFWIYYAGGGYRLARSNGNDQWDEVLLPLFNLICLSARAGGETYLGGSEGLFKSMDYGETWTELTGSVLPNLYAHGVRCLNNGIVLCMLGQSGSGYIIYRSTDNGNNWSIVHQLYLGNYASIDATPFHCDGQGNIYVGVAEYNSNNPEFYYHSNDDGLTWEQFILPDTFHVQYLFTDAANGLYVKNGQVLEKSTDNGLTWEPDMEGLPPSDWYMLIETEYSNMYLTMKNSGIYKKGVPVSAASLPPPSEGFSIYPNPAVNTLVIDYPGLSQAKSVGLRLYDISGKCLKEYTIASEKTTLDLSGLGSGIYILKGDGGIKKIVKIL